MPRKTSAKALTEIDDLKPKESTYNSVSLSDANGSVVLTLKKNEGDAVSYRASSDSEKDSRKVLRTFFDILSSNKIEQLRLIGIKHKVFKLGKMNKEKMSVASIVFNKKTDPDVLFDLLPICGDLKNVTLIGCTKYPYEKRHYAIRIHYSVINSFETSDFFNLRESIFSENPDNKNDPKFLPAKLLLKPYRYDTEFFVRYYLTPKSMAELIGSITSQGGFVYRDEWMVYKMIQNKQLLCKCGINGVYCVVVPAGCNTIKPTPFERFVSNDNDKEVNKLLIEPEEVSERREVRYEWNSLTDELKLKCIEHMHFKTRINLGSTCHSEKSLLASAKPYNFKLVKVEHLTYSDASQTMNVVAQSPKETINVRSERWVESGKTDDTTSFELTVSAVKHILQLCEINALFLFPGAREEGIDYLQKELGSCTPFRFSTFFSNVLNPNIQLFLVENCSKTMDMLYLRITKNFAPTKYFNLPQVVNSKCLQIHLDRAGSDASNPLCILMTKWITIDPEVGKKAVFAYYNRLFNSELRLFASRMYQRVISESDEMVLLRLDDTSKRILVYVYYDHDEFTYVTCRVISSELKESEYEVDERPWIHDHVLIWDFAEIDEEEENYTRSSFESSVEE
ncbi:unnamed protein product [Caenorhabditis brenneri]